MQKILVVWAVAENSTSVYELNCKEAETPRIIALQGKFCKLHKQGEPYLEDAELERLRSMFEKMNPIVKDFDSPAVMLSMLTSIWVIVCGYDPKSFEYCADYVPDEFDQMEIHHKGGQRGE